MKALVLLLVLSLTAGCAGRSLYASYRGTSTAAPDDTYQCVQEQLKTLGYRRIQFDTLDRWYVGQKEVTDRTVASGQYRKTVNVLDTRVRPDAAGNSSLEITAKTFEEYSNQRGVDRQAEEASEQAKQDAAALQRACAPQP